MEKIHLDIIPKHKLVEINGKQVKIPRLGLKHRMLVNLQQSHEEMLKTIIASIHPNLSVAERDIASLHLLEYNGKIPATNTRDGFTYDIATAKICQKLKFSYGDFEFKFRSPTFALLKGPADTLLKECCVSAKKNGEKIDVPDFMELPPFVHKWVEDITMTISIDGPKGPIKGLYQIVEVLYAEE